MTAGESNQVVRPKFIDKVEVNDLYARDFQYINTFDNVVGMEQEDKDIKPRAIAAAAASRMDVEIQHIVQLGIKSQSDARINAI